MYVCSYGCATVQVFCFRCFTEWSDCVCSVLIITHYTRILDYIKPEFVHMMKNGTISKSGDFKLAKLIEKNGYKETFELEGNETHE